MPGELSVREGKWTLTSKRRFRVSLFGKLVLQLEEQERTGRTNGPNIVWTGATIRWRDANATDLQCMYGDCGTR